MWFCRKVGRKRNGQAAKLYTLYVLIQSALRIVTVGMAMVLWHLPMFRGRVACAQETCVEFKDLMPRWQIVKIAQVQLMLAGPWSHTPRGMVGIRKSRWFDNGGWARDVVLVVSNDDFDFVAMLEFQSVNRGITKIYSVRWRWTSIKRPPSELRAADRMTARAWRRRGSKKDWSQYHGVHRIRSPFGMNRSAAGNRRRCTLVIWTIH